MTRMRQPSDLRVCPGTSCQEWEGSEQARHGSAPPSRSWRSAACTIACISTREGARAAICCAPIEDRIRENRRITALQNESDELKLTTFQRKKAIRQEVDTKLDNLANALKTTPEVTPVLTVGGK